MAESDDASQDWLEHVDLSSRDKKTLLKTLKELTAKLSNMGQDKGTNGIGEVAAGLAQKRMIGHRDGDVRVLVACCLADTLRLSAPNAPLSDDKLRDVFSLFIREIRGLEDGESGAHFDRKFYILERVAMVNSFVIVLDLDSDAAAGLLLDTFACFFDVLRSLRSVSGSVSEPWVGRRVSQYMIDVMVLCLTKADVIDEKVLVELLSALAEGSGQGLKEKTMTMSVSSCAAAAEVVRKCRSELQGPVTRLLNKLLAQGDDDDLDDFADTGLAARFEDFVLALNDAEPSTLTYVLPNMVTQLRVEDPGNRAQAVKLVGEILSARPAVAVDNPELFKELLTRASRDRDASVRAAAVREALPCILMSCGPDNIDQVLGVLQGRLLDPDEKVRLEAVCALCRVATEDSKRVTATSLQALAGRTLDKRQAVRRQCLVGISAVHAAHRDTIYTDKVVFARFGHLARRVVGSYRTDDAQTRHLVEDLVDSKLLPRPTARNRALEGTAGQEGIQRAETLVQLYHHLDSTERVAFARLCTTKHVFRRIFNDYLALRERNRAVLTRSADNDSFDGAIKEITSRAHALAAHMQGRLGAPCLADAHRCETALIKLASNRDEKVFTALARASDVSVSHTVRLAAGDDARKRVGSKTEAGEVVAAAIAHLAPVLDAMCVGALLAHVKSNITNALPQENVLPYLEALITVVSGGDGAEMTSSIECLAGVVLRAVKLRYAKVVEKGLELMALVSGNLASSVTEDLGDDSGALVKRLPGVCLAYGTSVARFAVRSIKVLCSKEDANKIFGVLVPQIVSAVEEAVVETPDADSIVRTMCALKCLAHVSQTSPGHLVGFEERLQGHLRVLASASDAKDAFGSDAGRLRELSHRLLAEMACAGKDCNGPLDVAVADAVKRLVTTVKGGSIEATATSITNGSRKRRSTDEQMSNGPGSLSTTAKGRLGAAVALMKAGRMTPVSEHLVAIRTFHALAFFAAGCSESGVRTKMMDKIARYVGRGKLPLQFVAVLVLMTGDADTKIAERACLVWTHSISALERRAASRTSASCASTAEFLFPYLVHLVAHQPGFDKQSPGFYKTISLMDAFLNVVLKQVRGASSLLQVADHMRASRDRMDPTCANAPLVASIALRILHAKSDGRSYSSRLDSRLEKMLRSLFVRMDSESGNAGDAGRMTAATTDDPVAACPEILKALRSITASSIQRFPAKRAQDKTVTTTQSKPKTNKRASLSIAKRSTAAAEYSSGDDDDSTYRPSGGANGAALRAGSGRVTRARR